MDLGVIYAKSCKNCIGICDPRWREGRNLNHLARKVAKFFFLLFIIDYVLNMLV